MFQPLEEALLDDGTTDSLLSLLTFYKDLIDQWMVFLLSELPGTSGPSTATSLAALTAHANALALTVLQTTTTVSTLSAILSFYETTASLITHPALKSTTRITIPSAEIIYTLFFTPSLSITSRLCAILALYKRAFELAMASKPASSKAPQQTYPKDYVNHFNGYLMDVCNCIWRSRAFNTADPNAYGCLVPPAVTQALGAYVTATDPTCTLPNLFGFSYSPLLCLFAIEYVRELEDRAGNLERRHAGPVTQNSLKQLEEAGGLKLAWPDYKLGVLTYMERKGIAGIGELMNNTMKHLMAARENQVQA